MKNFDLDGKRLSTIENLNFLEVFDFEEFSINLPLNRSVEIVDIRSKHGAILHSAVASHRFDRQCEHHLQFDDDIARIPEDRHEKRLLQ